MKFIKLDSFWKDTSAWLVNIDDIIFVTDKGDYRDVTIRPNGESANQIIRVTNKIEEIFLAIETSRNMEISNLPGFTTRKHLNS